MPDKLGGMCYPETRECLLKRRGARLPPGPAQRSTHFPSVCRTPSRGTRTALTAVLQTSTRGPCVGGWPRVTTGVLRPALTTCSMPLQLHRTGRFESVSAHHTSHRLRSTPGRPNTPLAHFKDERPEVPSQSQGPILVFPLYSAAERCTTNLFLLVRAGLPPAVRPRAGGQAGTCQPEDRGAPAGPLRADLRTVLRTPGGAPHIRGRRRSWALHRLTATSQKGLTRRSWHT